MALFRNIKEFFHNITTSDHYAQYDRHGQRKKQTSPSQGNTPRTSSQISLGRGNGNHNVSTTSLVGNGPSTSSVNLASQGNGSSTNLASGKSLPYRPGMRSQLHNDSQIELRNYENGHPIRSIAEIWDHIDEWLDTEFPELGDDIQGGATPNDLNAFEEDLDVSLPTGFRESYQIHDGQVTMGKARGLIFTYQLMDLETIAAETNIWRKVYNRFEKGEMENAHVSSSKGPVHSSTADRFGVQRSCPPNFVNEIYYDPLWIPFVKDNVGNNIALDLNPGEAGTWGQVILFGRDYDVKYVVADSFSEFLSNVCNDLEDDHGEVDEDEDLNYVYNGKVYNYFDVLKSKSVARAKKLDSSFSIDERKTQDVDLLISKSRPSSAQVATKRNPALDIRREENNATPPVTALKNEALPNETLISPVYPSTGGKKRDFTPSKDNIANNDSFVIDDDVLSVEEPVETVIEPVAEPVTEPVAEPVAEPVTEPITEPVAESTEEATEEAAEPVAESTEDVAEAVAEPVEETTQPVESTETAVEPAQDAVPKSVEEPVEAVVESTEQEAIEPTASTEEATEAAEEEETAETAETETPEPETAEVETDAVKTPAAGKKNNKKKNKKKGRK